MFLQEYGKRRGLFMANRMFARKPLALLLEEVAGDHRLRRSLGPVQLTNLGIGAIIGAGIFVATGAAAHNIAGPSLVLSYAVTGIICLFAALCYAELASMLPVTGSAYTYAYAALGEIFAWIIGWMLVLEYAVGSATVASGWSGYLQNVLAKVGLVLPPALREVPLRYDFAAGTLVSTGSLINLPAAIIVAIVTLITVKGIRESARFNAALVLVKIVAVFLVIGTGAFFIDPANWKPFAPYGWTGLNFFGMHIAGQTDPAGYPLGMLAAGAIIFFAYIGFDAVSTFTEEAKNPRRDVPTGLVVSLIFCTVLYILVTLVLTGMVRYDQLDINAPVSDAFRRQGIGWIEGIVGVAGVAGLTSILLVMMLSGPRIFLTMARDGLVPSHFFGDVHPKSGTPRKSTILTGMFVITLAGFLPLDLLLHLPNIGTLLIFVVVCAAVLVMRKKYPHAERRFRCPWVPFIPIMGISSCLLLMFSLPIENWWRLGAWLLLGLVVYFRYGRHHSVLKSIRPSEIAAYELSPAGALPRPAPARSPEPLVLIPTSRRNLTIDQASWSFLRRRLGRLDLLPSWQAWAIGLGFGTLAGAALAGAAPRFFGILAFLSVLGAAAALAWSGEPVAIAAEPQTFPRPSHASSAPP